MTYKLYPSKRQSGSLFGILRLHQQLYNAALEHRIGAYKKSGKSIGFFEQCTELTVLRKELEGYGQLNAQSCQVTLKRLDLAFQAFFRRIKKGDKKAGFPRFKSFNRYTGFGYKTHGDGWRLEPGQDNKHGMLRLSGVGHVKIRGRARVLGKLKTLDIHYKQGKWYASISYECLVNRECGKEAVGIDWGLSTFATIAKHDDSISAIANPRLLKKSLKALKVKQQSLSRKKRGSKNRERARKAVAKLHEKVANKRKEFLHQTTSQLIKISSLIAVEKLQIKGMSSNGGFRKRGLNREILSAAPGMFHQMLKYKAEEAGIEWIEISPRETKPTQTCHKCGRIEKKPLWQRMHECPCGVYCTRDDNAARVILNWALYGNATGEELTRY